MSAESSFQGSYDVFLNFRGKDTRNSFTAHLYEALCNNGIQTFMDASKIVKGEEISPALDTAMKSSKFCVVVLSKNYASSRWCLDELVQILKCKNAKKHTVLPIFYDVDPSDVREQTGSFADCFAKHEEKFKGKTERVQLWKQALREVARIAGWDARNRHEPTIIKEIIEHISNRSSKDAKAIVGMDSYLPVKERISAPNIRSLPSTKERSEFPLTSKRKIKTMDPHIPSPLSIEELSEFRLTSKRKIEEKKEAEIKQSRYGKAKLADSHLSASEPDSPTSWSSEERNFPDIPSPNFLAPMSPPPSPPASLLSSPALLLPPLPSSSPFLVDDTFFAMLDCICDPSRAPHGLPFDF